MWVRRLFLAAQCLGCGGDSENDSEGGGYGHWQSAGYLNERAEESSVPTCRCQVWERLGSAEYSRHPRVLGAKSDGENPSA